MLFCTQLRSLQWIFLLALILLEVEPWPIPKNCFPTYGYIKNVRIRKEQILTNETVPGYIVFNLPDGGHIRLLYHVDKYGFYTETLP
ncbi:uncharacterized protein LOC108114085 [Drosophila eugracilis]|uniref:uncharacterized protein LOC108114085 n=1 Tax=Drosophila eugracilis TaxID=29029 RepID=UPI0007E726D5|nr:uncharacterized protein LOC108114085 [Drosophila eugracilis]